MRFGEVCDLPADTQREGICSPSGGSTAPLPRRHPGTSSLPALHNLHGCSMRISLLCLTTSASQLLGMFPVLCGRWAHCSPWSKSAAAVLPLRGPAQPAERRPRVWRSSETGASTGESEGVSDYAWRYLYSTHDVTKFKEAALNMSHTNMHPRLDFLWEERRDLKGCWEAAWGLREQWQEIGMSNNSFSACLMLYQVTETSSTISFGYILHIQKTRHKKVREIFF